MQNLFGVKPQPPLEQVWLNELLNVLKPSAQRGVRKYTSADVRRLMAEPLDLVPHQVRLQSLVAALGLMTAKKFWLEQADGSFVLTPSGLTALDLSGSEAEEVQGTQPTAPDS